MNFDDLLFRPEFSLWRNHFSDAIIRRTDPKRHGDLQNWLDILAGLPELKPSIIELDQDTLTIGSRDDLNLDQTEQLRQGLLALAPWRKGPFELFGIHIDTEWRSDWKWQRVEPHIHNLSERNVLDVGCGTGYHCWRMLGAGAKYVMGIDPSMRFIVQHAAVNRYAQDNRFELLPIGIEDMPKNMAFFDTVFSMGVLYHRRNPINHLIELRNLMVAGGELVLETLIIDESSLFAEGNTLIAEGNTLFAEGSSQSAEGSSQSAEGSSLLSQGSVIDGTLQPEDRYAQMRNVWSVMTVDKILSLLEQAGFKNVRCVDQNITSLEEQRSTDWMKFHSLQDFLDPNDASKTIEGYPAPKRGIFIANK